MEIPQPAWPPEEWIARLRTSDAEAWQWVYTWCTTTCKAVLSTWPDIEWEDVALQTAQEVLEQIDTWDHVRSLEAYVKQRARWLCIGAMRAAQRERKHTSTARVVDEDGIERPLIELLPTPDMMSRVIETLDDAPESDDPYKAQVYSALQRCIEKLKPTKRALLALRLDDWPFGQIANNLTPPITEGYAKVMFGRIIKQELPTCLARNGFAASDIARIWGSKGIA